LRTGDIEKKAGAKFDRVTVYRTLQTFVEKGIIHSIPTADNSIRYALCKDNCEEGHHHDHHIHFVCTICKNTYCLDDIVTPDIKLPAGYSSSHIEVLAEGVCVNCSSSRY
jgi:Fur family ferric uptake transcriptional regulator